MARESSITFEQVAMAADAIKAQGGKATSRSVREVLGTGSMATILRFLQQWGGAQARQSQAIDDTLDATVVRSISNHIADRVQAATTALTAQLADQQAETDSLISENERQTTELDAIATTLVSLQVSYNQMVGVVQQLESDTARTAKELIAERQAAEAARVLLAKAEFRLEAVPRIEKEIQQVRDELATVQKQAAELHETAAVATAKLEAASVQRKEMNAQVDDLKTSLRDALSQVVSEQEKYKILSTEQAAALAKQVAVTHAAETRSAVTEATIVAQTNQINELKGTIEQLRAPADVKAQLKKTPTV
jgi:chromosome segregation ATPase